jgi:5-methylcytosine-specific restriction protein A
MSRRSGATPCLFHGGLATARKLRDLGFTVTEPEARRNPVWSRDELILALDLYMRRRNLLPDDKDREVVALSKLLNELSVPTGNERFRNPNGVAMKLQNFRRLDPDQSGKGLPRGGKAEEEV